MGYGGRLGGPRRAGRSVLRLALSLPCRAGLLLGSFAGWECPPGGPARCLGAGPWAAGPDTSPLCEEPPASGQQPAAGELGLHRAPLRCRTSTHGQTRHHPHPLPRPGRADLCREPGPQTGSHTRPLSSSCHLKLRSRREEIEAHRVTWGVIWRVTWKVTGGSLEGHMQSHGRSQASQGGSLGGSLERYLERHMEGHWQITWRVT